MGQPISEVWKNIASNSKKTPWPPRPLDEAEAILVKVGVVIFGIAALVALRQLIKGLRASRGVPSTSSSSSSMTTGTHMRRRLVIGLVAANSCRCLTLIWFLWIEHIRLRNIPEDR